jgi:galactonate dehydratase
MPEDLIQQATIRVTDITPKTKWIFVELRTGGGLAGVGEATAQGREEAVVSAFKAMAGSAIGRVPHALIAHLKVQSLPTLAHSAVVSALDQAAWDILGRSKEISVAAALGGEHRRHIHVYANINRRTLDRSPAGFARSAGEAIAAGHEAIKIAPFDEATPDARRQGRLRDAVGVGLERMRAVREQIGGDRRLMIDCHWRLDRPTAEYVIDAAAEAGLYWVECPLPENDEHLDAIRTLRAHANAQGVKLAGCEEMIRLDGFLPFLKSGAYDVLMPDAKYAGGLRELLVIAEHAERAGMAVSPHNPSGPVCHAASLQLCAAMPQDEFLEMQFDETPLFERLQTPSLPVARQGVIALPAGPGLGLALDHTAMEQTKILEWTTA